MSFKKIWENLSQIVVGRVKNLFGQANTQSLTEGYVRVSQVSYTLDRSAETELKKNSVKFRVVVGCENMTRDNRANHWEWKRSRKD